MAESAPSSTKAPVDFTNVNPIQLEAFAWLDPGWYKFRIESAKYTPASTNADGKDINANISWNLTVIGVFNPEHAEDIGKRIRDTFWYGAKGDFGMGRFMAALEAIRGKLPPKKNFPALDLEPFNGEIVICRVDDNNYNGRTSTQVQQYKHKDTADNIQKQVDEALRLRSAGKPMAQRGAVGEPDKLPDEEDEKDPYE